MRDISPGPAIEYAETADNRQLLEDFIHLRGDGRRLYKELFCYLKKYAGNYDTAEDVMVEVQLKAWENRAKFDSSRELRPWLYTLAINQCIDYQRKNKRWYRRSTINGKIPDSEYGFDYEPKDNGLSPPEIAEKKEDEDRIRKNIPLLPQVSREVIELVYLQGLEYQEAADRLGVPIGTIKSRLHNGIFRLEELLIQGAVA